MGNFLALLLVLLSCPDVLAARSFHGGAHQLIAAKPAGRPSARAVSWNNRGVDLYSAQKYEQALKAFDEAIKLYPDYADAFSNRGAANDALNHPELAVADYSEAIKRNSKLMAVYANRAAAFCDLGRFDEAVADLNVVIKHSPRDAYAWNRRGSCYKSLGNLQLALADFEKAVALNPKLKPAADNRDFLRKALQATVQETPSTTGQFVTEASSESVSANSAAGVNGTISGSNGTAAAPQPPVQTALTQDAMPDQRANQNPIAASCSSVIHHVLGNILFSCGQYDAAAQNFSDAICADPRDPFAYYRRGNAYMKCGNTEKAIADFDMAARISPWFKQAIGKRDSLLQATVPTTLPEAPP